MYSFDHAAITLARLIETSSTEPVHLVGISFRSTPQNVAYGLAEAVRGAKIAVIPDASHIVTVEAPAAVNAALEGFLNELADRSS